MNAPSLLHPESRPAAARSRRPVRAVPPTLSVLVALLAVVGLVGGAATSARAAGTRYEAEAATLSGGAVVQSDHTGYSGSGFVGGFTDSDRGTAQASFSVSATSAGSYRLLVGYANGTGGTRTFTVRIDQSSQQISLPATADWNTWSVAGVTATLAQGRHTVVLAYGSSDNGNANIDYLDVVPPAAASPSPTSTAPAGGTATYQAESAALSGGTAVDTEHSGYTGSGYVSGYTDAHQGSARTTFTVSASSAGTWNLGLRYAAGNGSTRTLTLTVDGAAQQVSLPATADWNTWSVQSTAVSLGAGSHTVAYSYGSADDGNANIDALTLTAASSTSTTPTPTPMPTSSPNPSTGTAGATVAYDEYAGSALSTNGSRLAASRAYPSIAAESTGRSAVQLSQTGQYVQLTLAHPANSVVVRYSIPADEDGSATSATLSLYTGGTKATSLNLTSKYADLYGPGYYDDHSPSTGAEHHFYDETRVLIGDQPAGTVIMLRKDAGDTASTYTIDLVDTEQVAAAGTMPSGYKSITDFGVTPSNGADDTSAIQNALSQLKGSGTGLWFPSGEYLISAPISYSGAAIKGAGMWRTTLRVSDGHDGGLRPQGGTVTIGDLSIYGDQTRRVDSNDDAGIEGTFGAGSTISDVWIEHTKVGIWTDGPSRGLTISGSRIRDVYADGVHFNGGTSDSTVKQSVFRNLGDDAIAFDTEGGDVTGCTADHDTIASVIQGNGIGVYGGGGNTVSNNLVSDSVAFGSGITVSSRFGQGFDGTTTVTANRLVRTGSAAPGYEDQVGALWFVADKQDLSRPIIASNNTILDSTYDAVKISYPKAVDDLRLSGTTIDTAGAYGIEVRASTGSASLQDDSVKNTAAGGLHNGNPGQFAFTDEGGNSGL